MAFRQQIDRTAENVQRRLTRAEAAATGAQLEERLVTPRRGGGRRQQDRRQEGENRDEEEGSHVPMRNRLNQVDEREDKEDEEMEEWGGIEGLNEEEENNQSELDRISERIKKVLHVIQPSPERARESLEDGCPKGLNWFNTSLARLQIGAQPGSAYNRYPKSPGQAHHMTQPARAYNTSQQYSSGRRNTKLINGCFDGLNVEARREALVELIQDAYDRNDEDSAQCLTKRLEKEDQAGEQVDPYIVEEESSKSSDDEANCHVCQGNATPTSTDPAPVHNTECCRIKRQLVKRMQRPRRVRQSQSPVSSEERKSDLVERRHDSQRTHLEVRASEDGRFDNPSIPSFDIEVEEPQIFHPPAGF
ncbi:uncharacterized protein MELLADRAFT_91953 [Melampsora larici-populina 98AG31]|uniref:Uncharacterized protein n=1 Tax=Melampsora larici-populina (strain 98AG31 / pathotype 3-4-7) TaxID=747676 RepID=F4S104_MELLP|nr:uncharacterized protein MELLADRAFT_91953 [Melampsora larici-populina 98AG31]EGG01684.1 hypothetical protein MELLADRAFT_91953 [Melampsora larici-populina 98AG31]